MDLVSSGICRKKIYNGPHDLTFVFFVVRVFLFFEPSFHFLVNVHRSPRNSRSMLLSFRYLSLGFYANLMFSFDFRAFWFHFASMLPGSGGQPMRKALLTVSTRHKPILTTKSQTSNNEQLKAARNNIM